MFDVLMGAGLPLAGKGAVTNSTDIICSVGARLPPLCLGHLSQCTLDP